MLDREYCAKDANGTPLSDEAVKEAADFGVFIECARHTPGTLKLAPGCTHTPLVCLYVQPCVDVPEGGEGAGWRADAHGLGGLSLIHI